MPTAGRLSGAVIFALLGWYFATVSVPFFPESRPPDWWMSTCTIVGLLLGWRLVGTRAGHGYNPAFGIGLTAGAALGAWLLFILSVVQMIKNSMRLRYDGPMEAVVDTFNLMLEFAIQFQSVQLVLTLLIGGVLCAWITEAFGQRYP